MSPDLPDDPFGACANCGESFEYNVSYPVYTQFEEDELELYSFCDEACKTEWIETCEGAASDD